MKQERPARDVHNQCRARHVKMLMKSVDQEWLLHMPMPHLWEIRKLVEGRDEWWIDRFLRAGALHVLHVRGAYLSILLHLIPLGPSWTEFPG